MDELLAPAPDLHTATFVSAFDEAPLWSARFRALLHEVYACMRKLVQGPEELARLESNEAHRGTAASLTTLVEGFGFRVARAIEEGFVFRFASGSTGRADCASRCARLRSATGRPALPRSRQRASSAGSGRALSPAGRCVARPREE